MYMCKFKICHYISAINYFLLTIYSCFFIANTINSFIFYQVITKTICTINIKIKINSQITK